MNGNVIFSGAPSDESVATDGNGSSTNVVYNIHLPSLNPALIEALKASPENQELFNQVFESMPQSVRYFYIC